MPHDEAILEAAQSGDHAAFELLISQYMRELRAHCYRMAGSLHEADDLMQESLLKAWKGLPGFERRADLRTWLYRVTTNVCLDALDKRGPRVLPMDLGPASGPGDPIGPPRLDPIWIEPCPAEVYRSAELSPSALYECRQSVALAFLVTIQLLPAKQRAALILHDVLGFQAAEIAEFLNLSVAAINSALQRARTKLASRGGNPQTLPPTAGDSALLAQYVQAWEQADVNALVAVLSKDARLAMPPLTMWLEGADAIGASIGSMVFSGAGPGTFKLIQTEANGQPAFAAYQRDGESVLRAMALHVIEVRDGYITSITAFLQSSFVDAFELPAQLANQ